MSDIVIFEDMPNDAAFIEWLKNNQNGFVLNINKGKTEPIYPMLHKASSGCGSFPTEKIGKNWTTKASDYFKVCSNSIEELEQWSLNTYNKELTPCRTCKKRGLLVAWYAEIKNLQAASALSLKSDIDELEECLTSQTDPEKRTEIETLIKARLAQGKFRKDVLKLYPSCPLTGLDIEPLLIASHIKPWSVCNNNERLDPFNGLMLAPHIDALFDKGLITFDTDGTIKISPKIDPKNQERLGISSSMKLKKIRSKSKKYFEYHRNHVFQKEE